ncbi:MAG: SDR family oxidoreductase [Rhodocyclaceae bacterium]|nr:SDR family oxidoreductase [Rhodocyclaceae bacterium]
MRVLVTGATGFVGRALCPALALCGHDVLAGVRKQVPGGAFVGIPSCVLGDIGTDPVTSAQLAGADAIVHVASRVHVMQESAADPLAAYRRVNVAGTVSLVRAAADAGVRRFVFLSSIKVNGEATGSVAFDEASPPAPVDPYGISKWEAERALADLAERAGMEYVILRPPLIYGPGVGANFLRLIRLVEAGWPLPLASLHNRRSMLALGNLCDAIDCCLTHPAAVGQTFLVSDGRDVSTPELIRVIAAAMGRPCRLFPFPPALLRGLAASIGRGAEADRLLGSLAIDSARIRSLLQWQPPLDFEAAVKFAVDAYRAGG